MFARLPFRHTFYNSDCFFIATKTKTFQHGYVLNTSVQKSHLADMDLARESLLREAASRLQVPANVPLTVRALPGNVGLGQVRYPTAGNAYSEEEAQQRQGPAGRSGCRTG